MECVNTSTVRSTQHECSVPCFGGRYTLDKGLSTRAMSSKEKFHGPFSQILCRFLGEENLGCTGSLWWRPLTSYREPLKQITGERYTRPLYSGTLYSKLSCQAHLVFYGRFPSFVLRCARELAFLSLPWPHQLPGVLAAAAHLSHFWLVCSEGK